MAKTGTTQSGIEFPVSSFQSRVQGTETAWSQVSRPESRTRNSGKKTPNTNPETKNPKLETSNTRPVRRLQHLLTNENLWLYILSLAQKQGEVYAYALDSEIEKHFSFKPNKIMIYVVLYKLEEDGFIKSEYQERRKYYKITEKGIEALESARTYFKLLSGRL